MGALWLGQRLNREAGERKSSAVGDYHLVQEETLKLKGPRAAGDVAAAGVLACRFRRKGAYTHILSQEKRAVDLRRSVGASKKQFFDRPPNLIAADVHPGPEIAATIHRESGERWRGFHLGRVSGPVGSGDSPVAVDIELADNRRSACIERNRTNP